MKKLLTRIKNFNKKEKIIFVITIIGIVAILSTLVTTSYAMLIKTGTSNEKDLFASKDMVITFSEEADSNININPAIPMSDEAGQKTTPYRFTITNSGDYKGSYTIKLIENAETTIPLNNVKYSINGNTPKLLSDRKDQILETGLIKAGNSKDFELRLWIDYEATTEISGTIYSGKISVNGKAEKIKTITNTNNLLVENGYVGSLDNLKIMGNSVQESENLYDVSKLSNGYYDTSGNFVETTGYRSSDYINVLESNNYKITGVGHPSYSYEMAVNYFNSNQEWVSSTKFTTYKIVDFEEIITIPEGISYMRISWSNQPDYHSVRVRRITPTPTNPIEVKSVGDLVSDETDENNGKYKISTKVSGKNLLDNTTFIAKDTANADFEVTETGFKQTKLSSSGYVQTVIYNITNIVKPNTRYYFHVKIEKNFTSTNATSESISGELGLKIDGTIVRNIYTNNDNINFVMPETFEKVELVTYTVVADTNIKDFNENETYYFEWKNLYMSTEPYTEYEKYIEPQTVDIYLDEPLRSVGDVSDYIDFETGKVVRNISVIDDFKVNGIYNKNFTNNIRFSSYDFSLPKSKYGTKEVLSEFLTYNPDWLKDEEYIFKHNEYTYNFYVSFSKTKIGAADEDTNETLIQKANDYISTFSKKKVYYAVETPIETDIELPKLNSFDGNIIISSTNTTPAQFKLPY